MEEDEGPEAEPATLPPANQTASALKSQEIQPDSVFWSDSEEENVIAGKKKFKSWIYF